MLFYTASQPNYSAAFICFGGERIVSRRRKRRESSFKTADHASSAWVVTGLWVSRAPLSQKCQFGRKDKVGFLQIMLPRTQSWARAIERSEFWRRPYGRGIAKWTISAKHEGWGLGYLQHVIIKGTRGWLWKEIKRKRSDCSWKKIYKPILQNGH